MTKREQAKKLRNKGLTYQEIGNILGCTKMWAHRLINKYHGTPYRTNQYDYIGRKNG